LLGGATARVGDPSGKSKERPVLDDATISRNSKGISEIIGKILEVLLFRFRVYATAFQLLGRSEINSRCHEHETECEVEDTL